MAVLLADSGMNLETKDLHPFFSKTIFSKESINKKRRQPPDPVIPSHEQSDTTTTSEGGDDAATKAKAAKPRRKTRSRPREAPNNQQILSVFSHRTVNRNNANTESNSDMGESNVVHEEAPSLEEDPNFSRRKRQKTATPDPLPAEDLPDTVGNQVSLGVPWHEQLQIEASKQADLPARSSYEVVEEVHSASKPDVSKAGCEDNLLENCAEPKMESNYIQGETLSVPTSSNIESPSSNNLDQASREKGGSVFTPPRKLLKLNAKGGLGSPIEESQDKSKEIKTKSKAKAKGKRLSKDAKKLIAVLKYPLYHRVSLDFADKVGKIMAGEIRHTPAEATIPTGVAVGPASRLKPTHPFFLAKIDVDQSASGEELPSADDPIKRPRRSVEQSITPGKLRAQAMAKLSLTSSIPFAASGNGSAFPRAIKPAGLREAPFPIGGSAHVRCLDDEEHARLDELYASVRCLPSGFCGDLRKMKRKSSPVPDGEIVTSRFQHLLCQDTRYRPAAGEYAHRDRESLRVPRRHLTTGHRIQAMQHVQLSVSLNHHSATDLNGTLAISDVHPAVLAIWRGIPSNLTPFDKFLYETQAWTQKYAPKCAADVLQTGKDIEILKNWLKSMTVSAVEGAQDMASANPKLSKQRAPGRKRKKVSEVDDFIVSSEDEDDELDFVTDSKELAPTNSSATENRTVLKGQALLSGEVRDGKVSNVVVISGPHGCGKTAAVYAVSKELGFEVFEINSSSRRSGRDILDRIGDMTENHLVRHYPVGDGAFAADSDQERMTDALQRDIDSGRQGKMTSFFQKNLGLKKSNTKAKAPRKDVINAESMGKKPRKHQKQSLILFEEADILFDEDKNFWPTIMSLAIQSKRPIVITCNDERLIPLESLPVQAILRFVSPNPDVAADYLLAMTANEGHLLNRTAVSMLLESKNNDLRASIVELNFWCQMAVGDRKGGLEWMYQRWPPGSDLDENGRVLRVASEGTYLPGLGWTPRDMISDNSCEKALKEQNLLSEIWRSWRIGPDSWKADHPGLVIDVDNAGGSHTSRDENFDSLRFNEKICDSYSAIDVCYSLDAMWSTSGNFDCTGPAFRETTASDYTIDRKLLQTDIKEDFTGTSSKIATALFYMTQKIKPGSPGMDINVWEQTPEALDQTLSSTILSCLSQLRKDSQLSRKDFANALDPIAEAPITVASAGPPQQFNASSLDREFRVVHDDLAPYVRSIVAHDLRLEEERLRRSNLLSSRGSSKKRMRTTRSAWSALEGGRRETTRRERWFTKDLNLKLVMRTGGSAWTNTTRGSAESAASATDDDNLAN